MDCRMMALLLSEKLMEIMSTREASATITHWLPSKILSKLFPSFRIYEEKMANLLSKDGDGKYEPNLGKILHIHHEMMKNNIQNC